MGENINEAKARAYGTRVIANFNDSKHRYDYIYRLAYGSLPNKRLNEHPPEDESREQNAVRTEGPGKTEIYRT